MPGCRLRAGVLGSPISHSRSPAVWRAAFAATGLDWTYEAVDCGEARLPEVLAEPGWRVVSLTMPLKHAAAALVDEDRGGLGAVNTVLFEPDGRRVGHNTDVDGVRRAVAELGVRPRRVVVLGAGGTADAVLAAAGDWDAEVVRVARRVPPGDAPWERAAELLRGADLVVNTTPAGAADALAEHGWPGGGALLDVLYAPWPTPLAAAATAAGVPVAGGLTVLVHQAARAFELATGLAAPLAAMRAAAERGV